MLIENTSSKALKHFIILWCFAPQKKQTFPGAQEANAQTCSLKKGAAIISDIENQSLRCYFTIVCKGNRWVRCWKKNSRRKIQRTTAGGCLFISMSKSHFFARNVKKKERKGDGIQPKTLNDMSFCDRVELVQGINVNIHCELTCCLLWWHILIRY